ncbi:KRAB-A domain-containing protein 2 [Trichinella pseudospiralis]|uniref:KRAB-A domain-containing protein 2 n=1 Tax=Trichinella pseudospiralis TaxID=6337 RepID=A0A0V1FAE7_TRIPS|nr:KRAB-A domain-containing protein 2 [Trichinella pseudospiralis]
MCTSDKKRKRNYITRIACISFTDCNDLEINGVSAVSYYCSSMAMDIKQQFDKRLAEIVNQKSGNNVIYSRATYDKIVNDLLRIQTKGTSSAGDHNLKKRFELLIIGEEHKLIRKRKNDEIRQIATFEDMFSIVRDAHSRIGHGGERKTFLEVQKKWANVTLEICKIYISFCKDCHLKRKKKIPKGLMVKSIVSSSIMSRGQVDLINYQTLPDGKFNYVMIYVDHFSKFCVLRPLTSESSEEVAQNLLDVFLLIGAPSILQSKNGREFVNSLITELKCLWPETNFINGRPHHPQSQGKVEQLNDIVKEKLAIWMRDNDSDKWSLGLKFVQWQINISVDAITKQSPYLLMFGQEPRVGMDADLIPKSLVNAPIMEENLHCDDDGPCEERTASNGMER